MMEISNAVEMEVLREVKKKKNEAKKKEAETQTKAPRL
jgi:hypothetical protein